MRSKAWTSTQVFLSPEFTLCRTTGSIAVEKGSRAIQQKTQVPVLETQPSNKLKHLLCAPG